MCLNIDRPNSVAGFVYFLPRPRYTVQFLILHTIYKKNNRIYVIAMLKFKIMKFVNVAWYIYCGSL